MDTVPSDNIASTEIYLKKCDKKNISLGAELSASRRCECFTVHACLPYVFR